MQSQLTVWLHLAHFQEASDRERDTRTRRVAARRAARRAARTKPQLTPFHHDVPTAV